MSYTKKIVSSVAIVLGFCIAIAHAQSAGLAFEVASVKINKSARMPSLNAAGNRFIATNANLIRLLQYAYKPSGSGSVRIADILGAAAWVRGDGFDIEATADHDGHGISEGQMRLLVQSLLADRFKLVVHHENRVLPVYDLIVAKGGSKIKRAEAPSVQQLVGMPSASGIALKLTNTGIALADFADWIQSYAGRPVNDKTNLAGLFNISLQFVPQSLSAAPPLDAAIAADPSGPSIFTALEEQLGLKLESAKGPVKVLVIDSVQKPSEN